jgi:cytochrome c peroxidase
MAGKAQFTPDEQAGYALFRGKANCNSCHRDGGPGEDPLFTDFTASNIGTPANPQLPYYLEDKPDAFNYTANPTGRSFIDGRRQFPGQRRTSAQRTVCAGCAVASTCTEEQWQVPGANAS